MREIGESKISLCYTRSGGSLPSVIPRARWCSACGVFVDNFANCGCFYSIGGRCYSGWWLWDLRTLAQFQGSEMSPALFEGFMVFVPGVAQGNKYAGSAQDFILLFLCKSGELGGRGSPEFHCVTSV